MADMNLNYIKKMVDIFSTVRIPFKDLVEPLFRGYNQLSDEEKEEFCNWLAGEPVQRGLRAKANIIDDYSAIPPDLLSKMEK